jgi:hypothetical protein
LVVALAATGILFSLSGSLAVEPAGSSPSPTASPPALQSELAVSVAAARAAICAGAVAEGPEETTITGTVTDRAGHAVAGRRVIFTTDHEFNLTAPRPGNGKPGHPALAAVTDARGQARITLVSGDVVTSGHVLATVGGVSGQVAVAFEAPVIHVKIWDRETGTETSLFRHGDHLRLVAQEEYRGAPVAHHGIHWRFEFWRWGTTSQQPDFIGVDGGRRWGKIAPDPIPASGCDLFTDEEGRSQAAYAPAEEYGYRQFYAADTTVFTEYPPPPHGPPPPDWPGWGSPSSAPAKPQPAPVAPPGP